MTPIFCHSCTAHCWACAIFVIKILRSYSINTKLKFILMTIDYLWQIREQLNFGLYHLSLPFWLNRRQLLPHLQKWLNKKFSFGFERIPVRAYECRTMLILAKILLLSMQIYIDICSCQRWFINTIPRFDIKLHQKKLCTHGCNGDGSFE